jgi:hypothetical protein
VAIDTGDIGLLVDRVPGILYALFVARFAKMLVCQSQIL